MSSLAETSKAIRGRARNLSIKTATSSSGSVHSSETDDTFSTGSFVHVSKPSSSTAELGSKKIEALLNTDWRTNRRPRADTFDPPKTAVPPKPKSSPKPALRVDTTRVTCDRIRDTPVDPDFIHSAPATKKEFALANDVENQNTNETHELQSGFNNSFGLDSRSSCGLGSGSSFSVHTDLSDLMYLNPNIRDSLGSLHHPGDISFSPTIKVTPAECLESGLQKPEFPLASMKKVEEGHKFITQS
ncbi:hypothetical protein PG996_007236 [Apiospora saccharicola]|uniref:Uncharacterized protein n=1 Tax=Apiospora saccharicola TaxID=335842 RepID=A0ABR1VA92_9PEZI